MAPSESFRVMVFSKTAGYRHESIPAGIAMFRRLADASKTGTAFAVDASEDAAAVFSESELARYRVLVLLHTSGDFLDAGQLAALQAYVRDGRGSVVAIHAAAAGMLSGQVDRAGWYSRLIGCVFTGHPAPQLGRLVIRDRTHPVMAALLPQLSATEDSAPEPSFSAFDEWYNFAPDSCAVVAAGQQAGAPHGDAASAPGAVHVLMTVDETTYGGGTVGDHHPVTWWQRLEGSGTRVFYTALGHFAASYDDDVFVQHLHDALLWAAGVL